MADARRCLTSWLLRNVTGCKPLMVGQAEAHARHKAAQRTSAQSWRGASWGRTHGLQVDPGWDAVHVAAGRAPVLGHAVQALHLRHPVLHPQAHHASFQPAPRLMCCCCCRQRMRVAPTNARASMCIAHDARVMPTPVQSHCLLEAPRAVLERQECPLAKLEHASNHVFTIPDARQSLTPATSMRPHTNGHVCRQPALAHLLPGLDDVGEAQHARIQRHLDAAIRLDRAQLRPRHQLALAKARTPHAISASPHASHADTPLLCGPRQHRTQALPERRLPARRQPAAQKGDMQVMRQAGTGTGTTRALMQCPASCTCTSQMRPLPAGMRITTQQQGDATRTQGGMMLQEAPCPAPACRPAAGPRGWGW